MEFIRAKERQLALARDAVVWQLLDPTTALFPSTWSVEHDGIHYLCGTVNGRNAFGAYVGPVPFVAVGISAILRKPTKDPAFGALFKQWCDRR